jgi:hypothetical protein
MKEHCFTLAIEAPNNQSDILVLGRLVRGLSDAGFKYVNVKEIAAQEHWNRAALHTTAQLRQPENDPASADLATR